MSIATRLATAALAAGIAVPLAANAGTFTTLYAFTGGKDGGYPSGPLIYQGGALYGTTTASGNGEVFKLDVATEHFKNLYAFKGGSDGSSPKSGVIYQNGILYGTTSYGGGDCNCGTIFSIDLNARSESTLYRFSQNSSTIGQAALVFLAGTLYGSTYYGGASGAGAVFSFNVTTGSFVTLHDFGGGTDGINPYPQLLYQNGLFYGTTIYGGGGTCHRGGCGTFFTVDPATGDETILHAFTDAQNGFWPNSNLVYHAGAFLGAAEAGGNEACRHGCGVSYAMSADGTEQVLATFTNRGSDYSGLTIVGGNAFETLYRGGKGDGALLEVNLKSGRQTVLYTFNGQADGRSTVAPLIYHEGAFYGAAQVGANPACDDGCGTVFKFVP